MTYDEPNDGGPIHPGHVYTKGGMISGKSMGMSLRDWFAGQALASIYMQFEPSAQPEAVDVAIQAYRVADAMLEERTEERGEPA